MRFILFFQPLWKKNNFYCEKWFVALIKSALYVFELKKLEHVEYGLEFIIIHFVHKNSAFLQFRNSCKLFIGE